jgi:hypothetical protein
MNDTNIWVREHIPADADLDRPALAQLATDLGRERRLWQANVKHDAATRFYHQLYRDPHLDIWLQCWIDGQETGYHDHDVSSGAVYVCDGTLFEDSFQRDADGWIRERTFARPAGSVFHFDPSYIHGLRHPRTEQPTVSIHCYSPALWRMGHYEPDATGMLRRISMTYADELLGVA